MDSSEENHVFNSLLNQSFDFIDSDSIGAAIVLLDSAKNIKASKASLGICFNTIGYCHDKKGDYHKALESYLHAVTIFTEIDDSISLAQSQINAASCYKIMGIYDRAIKLAMSSEKILRKDLAHLRELAVSYNLIGNIYTENANYEMAKDYHKRSLAIRIASGMSSAPSINNLGNCYFEQEKPDSALNYFTQYRDIAKEMGDERKVARSFLNMAKVHIKQGKSEMGIKLLNSSQALYSKLSYEKGLLFVHLTKSDYYLNNNLNLAKSEAESALQLAEALGLNQEKLIALKNLEEVMSKRNSYTQAYSYANKHYKLKNEIESKEHLSRIYSYEISSQLDQKNDELITLKRNQVISEIKRKKSINERNFFIVICVLAFLLALLLMYRYNEKKRFVEEYFASDTGVIMKTGKKLLFENIYRVETLRNDLIVIMNQGKITEKSTTLKAFSTNLPKIIFGRPQRGIILNFNYIDKVQKTKVTFQGESINISPKYGEEFLEQWERFLETRKA